MARELERGRQNVSVVVLDRLAKVLGIEAWELLQPQEGLETKTLVREVFHARASGVPWCRWT